jgi:hypothetical protein
MLTDDLVIDVDSADIGDRHGRSSLRLVLRQIRDAAS